MEEDTNSTAATPPKPRGFGALPPERRREISRKGGKSAHAQGKCHRFTAETARIAGKKGGEASRDKKVGVHKAAE